MRRRRIRSELEGYVAVRPRSVSSGLLLGALLLLTGCAAPSAAPTPDPTAAPSSDAVRTAPLKVVASTSLLADLAARTGGDRVQVVSLAPPGAEVHDYQPAPADARRVAEAGVLVTNGLNLDPWAERLIEQNARPDAIRVVLAEGMSAIVDDSPREADAEGAAATDARGRGGGNPHLWLDVRNARVYTEKLRDALVSADPAGASDYRTSQAAYAQELDMLDGWIRAQVVTIPEDRRKLVTFHDAFPYFARAYGFTLVGFIAPSTEHEPSAGELAGLVQRVREADVPAVFGEAQFSPKLAEALAREAGVKVVTDLYNDSLGPAPLDSYVAIMRHNTTRIVEALK